MTVRDNDGSIVQFMYGDDGIDVINTKYLDKFEFLEQNFNSLITSGQEIISRVDHKKVAEYKKAVKKKVKKQKAADPLLTQEEA